jgi:hypothetical protein
MFLKRCVGFRPLCVTCRLFLAPNRGLFLALRRPICLALLTRHGSI